MARSMFSSVAQILRRSGVSGSVSISSNMSKGKASPRKAARIKIFASALRADTLSDAVKKCYICSMKDERIQNIERAKKEHVPRWKQRARKMAWPIHARFPNIIPNPYGDDREYHRKCDAKSNAESALDEDNSLRLDGIMVSEIFGPNEIGVLFDGLEKMGWDRERTPVRDDSNIDWLKKQRLYGTEGRMPLGWIHRPDEVKEFIGVRYTAD